MGRLRWSEKFSIKNHVGSTLWLYICNDMNGPSVFNGPEVTMPRDALYYGGVGHREPHNAHSCYFHMATSNGFVKRGDGKDRPFVLSRAFFSGSRRCWWVFRAILRQSCWYAGINQVPTILLLGAILVTTQRDESCHPLLLNLHFQIMER